MISMEKGNVLWKKDKLNIFWDQCAHLNNRPSEDPYNFGQSVVEREESMDVAMITDQFALKHNNFGNWKLDRMPNSIL